MPKRLAFNMSIEPTLPTKCRSFKKIQYDENDNDGQIHSFEEPFRVKHILVVGDMIITSFKNVFEHLEVFKSIVGFLFDERTLKSLDNDEFKKSCTNLDDTFSHKDLLDVDTNYYFSILNVLQISWFG